MLLTKAFSVTVNFLFPFVYKHLVTKLYTKGECTPCWLVAVSRNFIYDKNGYTLRTKIFQM